MRKIFILLIIILLFISVACERVNEVTNQSRTPLHENWIVNAFIDENSIFGPFTISTQISQNLESITIKDNGEFWKFQTKAELVDSKDAFETQSSVNEISSLKAKINILDGKIINNDSITFDIQFEDDEASYGFTYTIKGHRDS